jgi:aminoglycoside phosphotransferase (APT) family kinase protein
MNPVRVELTDADRIDPLTVLSSVGLDGIASIEPVQGGADAAIWRVEHGGQRYALRVLRPDQADQARREVAAMRTAADGGVPVPGVVATATWHDRPVLLLSWCSGRPLAEALLAGPADLSRIRSLGVAFGRVQAAIHALPVPADLPTLAISSEKAATSEPALAARLSELPQRSPALIHLDYHPLNVLIEGERVTAVLDWANARVGDPRADLARTFAIVRLAPLPTEIPVETGRAALRAFETGWRRGYEEAAGPIGELAPFCWWAGMVMERELAPRVGRPDIPWLTPAYLIRVRRWTGGWRARVTRRRERSVAFA